MFNGFVRVAAAAVAVKPADCSGNADKIISAANHAERRGVSALCLPEMCVAGYTCGDLFLQSALLNASKTELARIAEATKRLDLLFAVGLPLVVGGKLYNAAAVLCRGKVLGFVPKSFLPNYGEFYDKRWFSPAPLGITEIEFDGYTVPFGAGLLFKNERNDDLTVGVEICEDLWSPTPPSVGHALNGATLFLNLSASDETVGKASYRRDLVNIQSARLLAAYVYAGAAGESSTDMTFGGHCLIAENGALLSESAPFGDGFAMTEIDTRALTRDRLYTKTFADAADTSGVERRIVPFAFKTDAAELTRFVDPTPFVPSAKDDLDERCVEILNIQSSGLASRLRHTNAGAVVAVSGGLDSALALLVTARAFKSLNKPLDGLLAVTMPCFGTTARTNGNAKSLCAALGAECLEIDITDETRKHFAMIGHDESALDVTYENVQARIRTMTVMNLANKRGALVVGTGDMSELALGWATYNGDHMSMYAVNAGVPKTLVRHLVAWFAKDEALRGVLTDILNTPVSPELLPPDGDDITQRTEDVVGPYELHDFFLYHTVRRGRTPDEIRRLAAVAFKGSFGEAEIDKWLRVFVSRFFSQQFKRSCMPDAPKVGSVTLSPRADWRMPSDSTAWLL